MFFNCGYGARRVLSPNCYYFLSPSDGQAKHRQMNNLVPRVFPLTFRRGVTQLTDEHQSG